MLLGFSFFNSDLFRLSYGPFTEVRSARLGVTTCDLQLQKVITSSSELRFGCS